MNWEILTAKYDTRPIGLQSFFRTNLEVQNSDCMLDCCLGASHSYYKVEPRTYAMHDGEFFVSWEGFYQNCSDDIALRRGLQWTVGISRISRSTACVFTSLPVKFEDCTTPDTILFQSADVQKWTLLGYSGLTVSQSPSGRRMFYLSVIERTSGNIEANGMVQNQIWVIPEGENYSKNPHPVQKFGPIAISADFVRNVFDDAGTIRLRLDEHGYPIAAYRTAYDAGIFCYSVKIDTEGILRVWDEQIFVTRSRRVVL